MNNYFKNIKVLSEKKLKEKLKLYFKTKDINIRNEIVEHIHIIKKYWIYIKNE